MSGASSYLRPCPICLGESSETVLSLAPTPLGDRLTSSPETARALPYYPLDLALCNGCKHAFLPLVVNPAESYSDYFFETGFSPGLSETMQNLAQNLVRESLGVEQGFVLDIGSNDGTWLKHFKDLGSDVLGIEPSSRHAELTTSLGITTVNDYFSIESAARIKSNYGSPLLITANYLAANIPNLRDFFAALAELADESTTIAILTGYHPDQFRINMFDFIYHEHTSYFTCQDFVNIGTNVGLELIDVRKVGLKAGSISAKFKLKSSKISASAEVGRMLQYEKWLDICSVEWYDQLSQRIQSAKEQTQKFIAEIKPQKIAGYGVSHSVTTLIHHFELTSKVSVLTDDNPRRQQKFAPGSGLEVIAPDRLQKDGVDTVVILAWQHDLLIRQRLEEIGFKGSVIRPLPASILLNNGE